MNAHRDDPLENAIHRFIIAVNEFISIKTDVSDPPKHTPTNNPLADIQRVWDDFKKQLRKSYEVAKGAEPEVAAKLETIIAVGNEVKALTDDPAVLNPVDKVVVSATDERAEIAAFIPRLGNATSFSSVMEMIGELFNLSSRTTTRRHDIAKATNDLTAYLMRRRSA
ncbi:hypothetical protein [Mycolicibacterium sp. A43C]